MLDRALIFCTAHIDGDPLRYAEWLEYYTHFFAGDDVDLLLVNDGPVTVPFDCKGARLETFGTWLGRASLFVMPGWKRSFRRGLEIASEYRYRAHVESDLFLLPRGKDEFMTYLRKPGYYAAWCACYGFMESALQIINWDDGLKWLLDRYREPPSWHAEEFFERAVGDHLRPFPILHGTRYEGCTDRVKPEMVYLAQARLGDMWRFFPGEVEQVLPSAQAMP